MGMNETSSDEIAGNSVRQYMLSPPHRAQILNRSHSKFGAGVTNKGRTIFNAQEFR
jgi:uncharacterized protein YkwD